MELTPLERDLLRWIAEHCGNNAVAQQLQNVKASSREYTGHGFFTRLMLEGSHPAVDCKRSSIDPHIDSPELDEFGAGCVLFFENGRASLLEIYANGDRFPEHLKAWTLI